MDKIITPPDDKTLESKQEQLILDEFEGIVVVHTDEFCTVTETNDIC